MGRWLTEKDKQFIKDNWLAMSNVKIADILGINKVTVSQKGKEFELPNKVELFSGKYKRNEVSAQIVNYGPGPETILEAAARKKTLELGYIKELLKDKGSLKLKVKTDGPNVPDKILDGTILQKNDSFIAVKLEKYIECFRYEDFFTGKAVII